MILYIHIPFCLKKCDYCDFFSVLPQNCAEKKYTTNDYTQALCNQIEFLAKKFCVDEWQSVYIGGGTPSLLSEEQIEKICNVAKRAAPLSLNAEFTIEANPGDITLEFLRAAKAGGINRLSLGIQCANDNVLKSVNRRTTRAQILNAVDLIKTHWGGAWGADFIAGLPFQTKEMLKADIDFIAAAGAQHISLYSLTLEEGTPLAAKIEQGAIHYDADADDELWLFGRDYLEEKGFMQYEISNFAKPGFESRHNGAYWKLEDYLGAGAGAVGNWQDLGLQNNKGLLCQTTLQAAQEQGTGVRGQGKGFRFTNTRDIDKYIAFWKNAPAYCLLPTAYCLLPTSNYPLTQLFYDAPIEIELLSAQTIEFEFLMMSLRTLRGVGATEYARRFADGTTRGDLAKRLGADKENGVFSCWQKKGLARSYKNGGETFFALTRQGILFLNKFLEEL